MIEEALTQARQLAHDNRLEGKELDELAELEDDEDEAFLEQYRCVRRPARDDRMARTPSRHGLIHSG